MNERDLLDPELRPLADSLAGLRIDAAAIARARKAPKPKLPVLKGVKLQEHWIPGPNPVRVYVLEPPNPTLLPGAAILHLHGGGYVLGAPEECLHALADLARKLGCAVVSVDYRLAPESPFPAGLDDASAAWQWLLRRARGMGLEPRRMALMGESAGGGLAAALAIRLRDEAKTAPCLLLMEAPMLDDRSAHPAKGTKVDVEHFVWTRTHNQYAWRAYLGGRRPAAGAVPARAPSLAGLPPTFISVGALDLFLDEDLAFAQRLAAAGVPVELHVHPGACHAFTLADKSAVAGRHRRDMLSALARAFAAS